MKLVSLNIWGGKAGRPLLDFIREQAKDTDVFCLQEVYNGQKSVKTEEGMVANIYSVISDILKGYQGFHAVAIKPEIISAEVPYKTPYGLAMFVKHGLTIKKYGSYEFFQLTDELGLPKDIIIWNRLLQYITLPLQDSELTVFNLHGLYTGGGKEDNEARLKQSARVKSYMENHKGNKILCGDFNLNPDTESLKILQHGMENLIKKYHITTTRSRLYRNFGQMKFADYVLVSPGINVRRFEVPNAEVSDHLPMILEFN